MMRNEAEVREVLYAFVDKLALIQRGEVEVSERQAAYLEGVMDGLAGVLDVNDMPSPHTFD